MVTVAPGFEKPDAGTEPDTGADKRQVQVASLLLAGCACLADVGTVAELVLTVRTDPDGVHAVRCEHADVRFGHVRITVLAMGHE